MSVALTPLQLPTPGGLELAVILLIAILLFGAQKIPKLARSTGQAMGEFKRGRQELEEELEGLDEGVEVDDSTPTTSENTADTTSSEGTADTTSTDGGSTDAGTKDEA